MEYFNPPSCRELSERTRSSLAISVAPECRLEYLSGLSFLFRPYHMPSVTFFVRIWLPHPLGYISQLATFAPSMSTARIRTVFCCIYFVPPFSSIMLGGKFKSPVPFSVVAPPLHTTDFVLLLSSRSRHSVCSLSVSIIWYLGPLFR